MQHSKPRPTGYSWGDICDFRQETHCTDRASSNSDLGLESLLRLRLDHGAITRHLVCARTAIATRSRGQYQRLRAAIKLGEGINFRGRAGQSRKRTFRNVLSTTLARNIIPPDAGLRSRFIACGAGGGKPLETLQVRVRQRSDLRQVRFIFTSAVPVQSDSCALICSDGTCVRDCVCVLASLHHLCHV